MRTKFLCAATVALMGCDIHQDLGQGAGGSTSGTGGATGTTASSSTSSSTSSSSTSSSSTGTTTTSSSGMTTVCSDPAGYPTVPGITATIAGGMLPQSLVLDHAVHCAIVGDSNGGFPPEAVGKYAVTGDNIAVFGQEAYAKLYLPVAHVDAGMSYPFYFTLDRASGCSDCKPAGQPGTLASYPPVSGPGTCTMTVDQVATGGGCLRARFTCTGLVGASSGESFDVTDGVVVCNH